MVKHILIGTFLGLLLLAACFATYWDMVSLEPGHDDLAAMARLTDKFGKGD